MTSVVESWTVEYLCLCLQVLVSFSGSCFIPTFNSSGALTSCCPLYSISTVSLSFALRLALGCSSARGGLFKLSFTRREKFPFDPYLECTKTAMAAAALTVEPDVHIHYQKKKNTSGCFFIEIMVSSDRVLNDCTLSCFQFDLQDFIEVRDGFACVADLEILINRSSM